MPWILVGYMWLVLHRPFEEFAFLAAFPLERTYIFLAVTYWLLLAPKVFSWNRVHGCFAIYLIFILFSTILSPFQSTCLGVCKNHLEHVVFYVLLVTSIRDTKQLRIIVIGHIGIMTLFTMHSFMNYHAGNAWYSQGMMRMKAVGSTFADFNDFAGLLVIGIPFAWALWPQTKARWQQMLLLAYCAMSAYCLVRTGSRMGAIGFTLFIVFATLTSRKRRLWIGLSPLLFAAVWSLLPEDRQARYLTLVGGSYETQLGGTVTIGEMRVSGFTEGLTLLAQRPLFGYGPKASGQAMGHGHMPHNMYGQLLGEFGILGAIGFGLLNLAVVCNLLEGRLLARSLASEEDALENRIIVCIGIVWFLLLVMGWGFNFLLWHVWLWYGGIQVVALNCLQQRADVDALDRQLI